MASSAGPEIETSFVALLLHFGQVLYDFGRAMLGPFSLVAGDNRPGSVVPAALSPFSQQPATVQGAHDPPPLLEVSRLPQLCKPLRLQCQLSPFKRVEEIHNKIHVGAAWD